MVDRLREVHGITPRTLAQYLFLFPIVVIILSLLAKIGLTLIPAIKNLWHLIVTNGSFMV